MSVPGNQQSSTALSKLAQSQQHEASDVEDPRKVDLAEMFRCEDAKIERKRSIQLQQRMFAEFEKRERQRKISELVDVAPGLDEKTAARALETSLCMELSTVSPTCCFDPRLSKPVHVSPGLEQQFTISTDPLYDAFQPCAWS
eukprot:gene23725-9278_t